MPPESDTWNIDLFEWAGQHPAITIVKENMEMGQKGHHQYLNELFKWSHGCWILNFCDDMYIKAKGWDDRIRDFIREKELYPNKCYMLIPRFEIDGAVEHILSRGWIDTVGFISAYQNTDSWLNTVSDTMPEVYSSERRLNIPGILFEDYSNNVSMNALMELHDRPDNKKTIIVADFKDDIIQQSIKEAANKVVGAINGGR